MPELIDETILDWRADMRVEHETRVIRNVALAGMRSRNGYRYSGEALRKAVALYESVPVFLDHPRSAQQPRQRSARDLAGRVRNARFDGTRLRGDLDLIDTEAGRTLLALAATDGPGVGMSHVVLAERSEKGDTVERILEVISVDVVAFPATTTTLREGRRATSRVKNRRHLADSAEPVRNLPKSAATTATLPGSLERLLQAIDRQLPAHAERLIRASGGDLVGSPRRVALFPRHLVLEWSAPGSAPRRMALRWRLDRDGVHFAQRFVAVEEFQKQPGSWRGRLGPAPRPAMDTEQVADGRAVKAPAALSQARRATTSVVCDDTRFIEIVRRGIGSSPVKTRHS